MAGDAHKIIVVEDDDLVRDLTVSALETSSGRKVLSFEDGAAAWGHLSADEGTEIILSDVQMPQMNGLELLSRVKSKYPAKICILMSADPTNEASAVQLGADAFLVKPFRISELAKVIRKFELRVHSGALQPN